MKNPHDKFFKETFGNIAVAGDFLTNYLPPSVIKHIDIETLEPQKDSFQEGSEIMMTLADMWREEGIEQGLEQGMKRGMEKGIEQGLEKGMRIGLIEMIEQGLIEKFKKVPLEISKGIQELDTPVLKVIVRRIMSEEGFKSLDDVREYL